MHCIGCPIGQFHTVAEACTAHDRDLVAFLYALNTSLDSTGREASGSDPDEPTRAVAPRA
jgi:hypothetical protein